MQKFILPLLTALIFPGLLTAQQHEACLEATEVFAEASLTSPEDLEPGAIVFLSPSYLDELRRGVYARDDAGLRHYEYIRPGTREEIRSGLNELASANEILAADGNVYKQVPTPPGTHFFQPRKGFHGEYEPEWRDPNLIIPPGLLPVDVRFTDGMPLQVLEFQPSFLRLRAEEAEWVFFTGYPEIPVIFESEAVRKKLARKLEAARSLIGKELLLEIFEGVRITPSVLEPAVPLSPAIRYMELVVADAEIIQDEIFLAFGNPIQHLVIDPGSELSIFDLGCERELLLQEFLSDPATNNRLDRQLDAIISSGQSVDEWSHDNALVSKLRSRFRLQKDDRLDHRWYEHVFLYQESAELATYLTARLREDGTCYVQSHYASRQGLYHTRVELDIPGADPIVSSRVPTISASSERQRQGAWTIESITFSTPEDERLLEILVSQPDAPIMVRYSAGGSFFKEAELSPVYRGVIRDAYLLSELIRYQNTER